MATKLDLDNAQHSYKLINCVPAGDGKHNTHDLMMHRSIEIPVLILC